MHMASLPPEHVGHFTDAVAKESTCKMNVCHVTCLVSIVKKED